MPTVPFLLPALLGDALNDTLPDISLDISVGAEPFTNVNLDVTQGGRELRSSWQMAPRWRYRLKSNVMWTSTARSQTWQQLVGFFVRRFGRLDSFLFQAPDDYTVTDHPFSKGDGTTTFQLQRTLIPDAFLPSSSARLYWPDPRNGYEPVYEINTLTSLSVAGVAQSYGTDYTVQNGTGIVTFASAPATGAVLAWTGTYYKRVRFDSEGMRTSRIVSGIYAAPSIDLVTVIP